MTLTPVLIGSKGDVTPGVNTTVVTIGTAAGFTAVGSSVGDCLALALTVNNGLSNTTPSTVVDSKGNTWTAVAGATDSNIATGEPLYWYMCQDAAHALVSGTDTITITWTGALPNGGSRTAIAVKIPGAATTAQPDATGAAHATTAAPTATTTAAPKVFGEVVLAASSNAPGGGQVIWGGIFAGNVLCTSAPSQLSSVAFGYPASPPLAAVTAAGTLTASERATIGLLSFAPAELILLDQKVVGSGISATPAVNLTEQHADNAGGSLATVIIEEQKAVVASVSYVHSSMSAASGTGGWNALSIFTSDGSGSWTAG